MPWRLKRSLLRDLTGAAKSVYPNEFIAMLSVSKDDLTCLSEFVVIPAEYGRVHSQLRTDLIPFDSLIVGSVHSHPSPTSRASTADKVAFLRLGKIHLILAYPYSLESFSAYSSRGVSETISLVD